METGLINVTDPPLPLSFWELNVCEFAYGKGTPVIGRPDAASSRSN